MPTLAASHAATLPRPLASPSLALRSDGTAMIVGSGIVAFKPGSPVADLSSSPDVPVEAGVSIEGNVLSCFGGHSFGDEWGALDNVSTFDATTGAQIDMESDILPYARRGMCAVKHGKKTFLFGGISSEGHPSRDIVIVSPGKPIRALRVPLPSSCAYLQAGAARPGADREPVVFLLGSGTQYHLPPKAGYDLLVSRPGDMVIAELFPALQGTNRIGVCAIQKDADTFFSFGGADANGGVSATLYRHTNGATDVLGDVLGPDGQPYRCCYVGGIYVAAESAIYLIGGLNGSPYSTSVTPSDLIVRVEVA